MQEDTKSPPIISSSENPSRKRHDKYSLFDAIQEYAPIEIIKEILFGQANPADSNNLCYFRAYGVSKGWNATHS